MLRSHTMWFLFSFLQTMYYPKVMPSSFSTRMTYEFSNRLTNSWTNIPCQSKWSGWCSIIFCCVASKILGWKYISLPKSFPYSFYYWFSITILNNFFFFCRFYSTRLHFWWWPLRLLSFKHLLLAYLSMGSRLWRKMFYTIGLIAPQW